MKEVQIENIGPISNLTIPLPDSGVVVLRGRNGVGKSHALAAVDSLVSRRGRPVCRDHAKRGVVEAFGARMTIGRSTRRTGEAEVLTLEGRLDISQLVDPGLKDAEAADRTRIKALVQLSGAQCGPEAFADIMPDEAALDAIDLEDADPVTAAARVKRAVESRAREYETLAKKAEARVDVAMEDIASDNDDAEPAVSRVDAERSLRDAVVSLDRLRNQAAAAQAAKEQAAAAREQLDELKRDSSGASTETLEQTARDIHAEVRRLRTELDRALIREEEIEQRLAASREMDRRIEALQDAIAAEPELVPDSKISRATKAVEAAQERVNRAIEHERVAEMRRVAEEHAAEAKRLRAIAEKLRDAGRATDDILTDLVSETCRQLRVDGGRLVTDTDRGAEPFGDLSPGERWRIALEIAAEQVGQGGLVTVPQEAWEALDPSNQRDVADIARRVGVVILTAEATDDDTLLAEEFGE